MSKEWAEPCHTRITLLKDYQIDEGLRPTRRTWTKPAMLTPNQPCWHPFTGPESLSVSLLSVYILGYCPDYFWVITYCTNTLPTSLQTPQQWSTFLLQLKQNQIEWVSYGEASNPPWPHPTPLPHPSPTNTAMAAVYSAVAVYTQQPVAYMQICGAHCRLCLTFAGKISITPWLFRMFADDVLLSLHNVVFSRTCLQCSSKMFSGWEIYPFVYKH